MRPHSRSAPACFSPSAQTGLKPSAGRRHARSIRPQAEERSISSSASSRSRMPVRLIDPRVRRGVVAVLLTILALLAIVSVGQGFLNALSNSQDLQWSPVFLLSTGVNPYRVALDGNQDKTLILYQVPPYLHILYIVTLPLALLSFKAAAAGWAALSLLLSLLAIIVIGQRFGSEPTAIDGSRVVVLVRDAFSQCDGQRPD